MLNSVYLEKVKELSDSTKCLTEAQISLLTAIQSKTRFEQLMSVLPKDWEKHYKINFYTDPSKVSNDFMNKQTHKTSFRVYEYEIISVIVSDRHPASPGKYEEHLKRDADYPIEEDKWKIYMGLTELKKTEFHVDHKLIWTARERKVDFPSKTKINDAPYEYSINIYVPNDEYLIKAETIKLNNLI